MKQKRRSNIRVITHKPRIKKRPGNCPNCHKADLREYDWIDTENEVTIHCAKCDLCGYFTDELGNVEIPEKQKVLIMANFEHAGTERFVSHAMMANETITLCGLSLQDRPGQWEAVEVKQPSCSKCQKALCK